MNLQKIILGLFMLTILACSNEQTTTPVKVEKSYPEIFNKVLKAHGGKANWDAMNTLTYTRGGVENPEYHTVDLKTRKSLIEVKGKYKLGFDGTNIWVGPNRDSFPGKSPKFTHNLHFYFIAIPFVFTDPGVTLKDEGLVKSGEKEYHLVNVTFGENVGDAPEDQYNMYIDPVSNRVDFITYSVTYFDKSRATQYNALQYEWIDANGLLAPAKYIGYKWENEDLGDQRYESVIKNVRYEKATKAANFFEKPVEAEITVD